MCLWKRIMNDANSRLGILSSLSSLMIWGPRFIFLRSGLRGVKALNTVLSLVSILCRTCTALIAWFAFCFKEIREIVDARNDSADEPCAKVSRS